MYLDVHSGRCCLEPQISVSETPPPAHNNNSGVYRHHRQCISRNCSWRQANEKSLSVSVRNSVGLSLYPLHYAQQVIDRINTRVYRRWLSHGAALDAMSSARTEGHNSVLRRVPVTAVREHCRSLPYGLGWQLKLSSSLCCGSTYSSCISRPVRSW